MLEKKRKKKEGKERGKPRYNHIAKGRKARDRKGSSGSDPAWISDSTEFKQDENARVYLPFATINVLEEKHFVQ